MRRLLAFSFILLLASVSFAEEHYMIIDTDGTVLRICSVNECQPNANELKLFKIVKVDINDSKELNTLHNNMLDQKIDGERINKLDASTFTGNGETKTLNEINSKIVSNISVSLP